MIYTTLGQVDELDKSRNCPKCKSGNVKLKSNVEGYFWVCECLECKYRLRD